MWTCLILFGALASHPMAAQAETNTPLLDKGLVFVEKNVALVTASRWVINVDIDMGIYEIAISNFTDSMINIRNWKHENTTLYTIDAEIFNFIDSEMVNLNKTSAALHSQLMEIYDVINGVATGYRQKRALIEVGGRLIKWVFGNLDQRDYEYLNNKIENITLKDREFVHLMKDQLTIVSNTHSLAEQNQVKIQKLQYLAKVTKDALFTIEHEASEHARINRRLHYLTAITQVSNSLSSASDAILLSIQKLKAAFFLAIQGRLDPFFLPYQKFTAIIRQIQVSLQIGDSTLARVSDSDLELMYHLAKVTLFQVDKKLRLFVDFPVYDQSKLFTIYETLPLPAQIGTTGVFFAVEPKSTYLAVSQTLDYHFEMSQTEFQDCNQHKILVCFPGREIAKSGKNSCLFNLFTGRADDIEKYCAVNTFKSFHPIFYKSAVGFEYIYSVERPTIINFSCTNSKNKLHLPSMISGNGILQVPDSCMAFNPDFVLFGNNALNVGDYKVVSRIEIPKVQLPSIANITQRKFNLSMPDFASINTLFQASDAKKNMQVDIKDLMAELDALDQAQTILYTPYRGVDPGHILLGIIICLLLVAAATVYLSPYWRKYTSRPRHIYDTPVVPLLPVPSTTASIVPAPSK